MFIYIVSLILCASPRKNSLVDLCGSGVWPLGLSGLSCVEKQLWLAWQVVRGYVSMKARTVKALNVSYVIVHLQFKSSFH